MIDYRRLKDAGNIVLSNPVLDANGDIKSIDVQFNIYDKFSGTVASIRTATIKRSDVLSQMQNHVARLNEIAIEAADVENRKAALLELIADAKAIAGI